MDELSTGQKVAISIGVIVPVVLAVVLGCVYGIPSSSDTSAPASAPASYAPITAPTSAAAPTYTLAPVSVPSPRPSFSLAPVAGPGFPLRLRVGATYLDATKTSFQTNGTSGYAITAQPFTGVCTVGGYTSLANASYIGLTDPDTLIADATYPAGSFSYLIYTAGSLLTTLTAGVVNSVELVYASYGIDGNTASSNLSVSYNGVDICFYFNGVEVPSLRISNVGTGRSFYGVWASYTNKTFSNLVWSPTALQETALAVAST